MLIEYQTKRQEDYGKYLDEKAARKAGEEKKEEKPEGYNKLYKQLGTSNRNKDIRKAQQEHLDEYLENQLSPVLSMNFNPNYRRENTMTSTQFRDTHVGRKEEPTDKVYFRKQDEVSAYAEAMFKCKDLIMGKK